MALPPASCLPPHSVGVGACSPPDALLQLLALRTHTRPMSMHVHSHLKFSCVSYPIPEPGLPLRVTMINSLYDSMVMTLRHGSQASLIAKNHGKSLHLLTAKICHCPMSPVVRLRFAPQQRIHESVDTPAKYSVQTDRRAVFSVGNRLSRSVSVSSPGVRHSPHLHSLLSTQRQLTCIVVSIHVHSGISKRLPTSHPASWFSLNLSKSDSPPCVSFLLL